MKASPFILSYCCSDAYIPIKTNWLELSLT